MKALLLATALALAPAAAQAACMSLQGAVDIITADAPHVVGELKPAALTKWQDARVQEGAPDAIRETKRMVIALGREPEPHADLVELDAQGCVRGVSSVPEEVFLHVLDKVFGGSLDILQPVPVQQGSGL